jgi:hypothetical protein
VVGTLCETLEIVSIVSERAAPHAGVVDLLCEVACTAPPGTIPSDIVSEEALLAGIYAKTS